jgi:beta-galactosidase
VPDRPEIRADRQDLSFIALSIVDDQGARIPCEDRMIHIEVSGAGHLAGIGNANPCTVESYGKPCCKAYEGRALAAVIADEAGEIRIKVWADGIPPREIAVTAVSAEE